MLKLFFIGFFATFISGCVSGPKNPDQTISERLNANSYESSNSVMGVPVLTRTPITKKITGRVLCGEGLSQRPASHATVSLLDAEKTYKIQGNSKCGNSEKEISLKDDSNYHLILTK